MNDGTIWFHAVCLAASAGALLVHSICKATLLLLVIFGVMGVLRRSSAALRHSLWLACCFSLLLLPVFVIALPAWQPVVPHPLPAASNEPGELGSPSKTTSLLLSTISAGHSDLAPVISAAQWILAALFLFWLVGVMVATRRMVNGLVAAKHLQSRGHVVKNGELWSDFTHSAELLNMQAASFLAPPRLMLIDVEALPIPLTWGFWRPVVLMPYASLGWSASCRRAALLHELSHIQRRDWFTQSFASVVCVLYWPHPMVWWASRRLRFESERATDDHVLTTGLKATDYSSSLLEIVRSIGSPGEMNAHQKDFLMKFAVPMSGTSKIEARLRSVLDPKQSRSTVTTKFFALISLVTVSAAIPLAAAKEPTTDQPHVVIKRELTIRETPPETIEKLFPNRKLSDVIAKRKALTDKELPTTSKNLKLGVVTGYKFKGNTLIPAEELQKKLVSQRGTAATVESIEDDEAAIRKVYSDKGFATLVQNITQDGAGVISYDLLEAKITQIKVAGLHKTDPQVIRKLINTPVNAPFDMFKLRRDMERSFDTGLFWDATFNCDDDPKVHGGLVVTFLFREKGATEERHLLGPGW